MSDSNAEFQSYTPSFIYLILNDTVHLRPVPACQCCICYMGTFVVQAVTECY